MGISILIDLGQVLGLRMEGTRAARAQVFLPQWEAAVTALVRERDEARRRRDWGRADAIRAQLEAQGVILEDTPSGTRWKKRASPNEP
jgi:cysteinyl-tRNA synthetase